MNFESMQTRVGLLAFILHLSPFLNRLRFLQSLMGGGWGEEGTTWKPLRVFLVQYTVGYIVSVITFTSVLF